MNKSLMQLIIFSGLSTILAIGVDAGSFDTRQLSDKFASEGAAIGDLNKDGAADVVYGPYWFQGPSYEKRHTIYEPAFFQIKGYSNNFFPFVEDLDADGWPDVLVLGFPGRGKATYWYRNPGQNGNAWERHVVYDGPGNESPTWIDADGDGRNEILCSMQGQFGLVKPDPAKPTAPWTFHPISPPKSTGGHFTHGLGLGDIDGDGKLDLLEKTGWWKQRKDALWEKHPFVFSGPGGAQMYAYDFDGDGDNDVLTSLAAHAWGLAWFEQQKDGQGAITFKRHLIMGSKPAESPYGLAFSQLHGIALEDVDGDELKDIITGKRWFAHGGKDPGGKDPAVIYWFRTVRGEDGVDFVPHKIHGDSGVGTSIATGDLNGDGKLDIAIGNKKGCFVHVQTVKAAEPLIRKQTMPEGRQDKPEARHLVEGESLEVVSSTGQVRPQNMNKYGAGVWGGDSQLWWTGAQPGDQLKLSFDLPAGGEYRLGASMTRAVDYGIFELSLNGKILKSGVDLYQPENVSHTGDVDLGHLALKAGRQIFIAKVLGAHPDAKKGYMFGLDCLRVVPIASKASSLFDGKTLKNWQGTQGWWSVEDGAITGTIGKVGLKRNEFLFWDGELHDFELKLKFRFSGHPSANSGVQIRSRKTGHSAAGYQADLDGGKTWAGRIYDEHGRGLIAERGVKVEISAAGGRKTTRFREPTEYANLVKTGEWNSYRIRAVGPHIQTWLNGELAADLTDHQIDQQDFSGKLALQLHSGSGPAKIQVKDIRLQGLGKTEKAKPLPAVARSGISPRGFNLGFESGKLDGWTTTGTVWKGSPIRGNTVTPRRPEQASKHDGEYWVGGYERTHDDKGQGTLSSKPFPVTHPWGSFLIGGGPHKDTRVELVDAESNRVLFTEHGEQVEDMRVVYADLSAHQGKKIFVRVVDESSGPWGHMNYDDFRFHASKPIQRPGRLAGNRILQHLVPNPALPDSGSTAAGMWVPEGFRVDLIAREPAITQPIAFTIDERGRLWVVEAHSYPKRRPDGQGLDKVVVFEDGDGDGSYETKTIFAEGLNLVSGIEVGFGGVWIGAAPELLFIPDRDGDDVPDGEPVVLLDGWGFQDTHETLNSFTWGPDGWLYGNQGVFCTSRIGKPGASNEERVELRAGVWRYHPQRHVFEVFARGCSNQWGLDFNELGHMFLTHCRSAWGGGPTTYVVHNGHYWNQANRNHAPFVSGGLAGYKPAKDQVFRNFLSSSAGYGHGEGGAGKPGSRALYGGHSHVGTMIYLGGNWPEEYRDQLFTHNLHGHQMNRQVNRLKRSGYETVHAGGDQLYTPDKRFIGVALKYGPDGAVYMIDWYDKQHCHTNKEEAWNRSDGRIYRMGWAETWKPASVNLREKSTPELVALVTSRDEWFSRIARRLLQERGDPSALPLLRKQLAEADTVPATLRAMWSLHLIGDAIPRALLSHEHEAVRAWAVRLLAEGDAAPVEDFVRLSGSDPSAMVRLALASAMPRLNESARWRLAEKLCTRDEDIGDSYLPKMIWFGIGSLASSDPERTLNLAASTRMRIFSDSAVWFLSRDETGREVLVRHLEKSQPEGAQRILTLMVQSLPTSGNLPTPPGWSELSAKLRSPQTAGSLNQLGVLFGDESMLPALRNAVADTALSMPERRKAFDLLKRIGDTASHREFTALLEESAFRSDVIPLLGRFDDDGVGKALVDLLPSLSGGDRNAALGALSAKPKLALAQLKAIKQGALDKNLLTSLHIRQMQNLGNDSVNGLLADVWGKISESSADAKASMKKFRDLYTKANTRAVKMDAGKEVFTRLCAICHVMNGEGGKLGPDLSGSHGSGLDYFIENIVDPNAVIGENFQLNIVTLKDDTVVSGMPSSETADTLTIQGLIEATTISRSDIKSRQVLLQSMMPPALLDTLPEKDVNALLKYLVTPK